MNSASSGLSSWSFCAMSAREMREYDKLIILTPAHKHTTQTSVSFWFYDNITTPKTARKTTTLMWSHTCFNDVVSQADDQRVRAVCLELLSKLIQYLVKLGKISSSHRWLGQKTHMRSEQKLHKRAERMKNDTMNMCALVFERHMSILDVECRWTMIHY